LLLLVGTSVAFVLPFRPWILFTLPDRRMLA
jgi:hypothetical protein